jgi:hypothetical protein
MEVVMPQLHLYVPEDVAEALRKRAEAKQLSLSKYLADIVKREVGQGWPDDFFTRVAGGWHGDPLVRPEELLLEERQSFNDLT